LSFVYVFQDSSNAYALISSAFNWGCMVWIWMDGIFLVLMIILHFDWVVYLSGLVKYFAY
jgi:hypothetical protein